MATRNTPSPTGPGSKKVSPAKSSPSKSSPREGRSPTDKRSPTTAARSPTANPDSPEGAASPDNDILPAAYWAQHEPVAEEPQTQDDQDSAFGDAASSTASLSASILEYRTIQGRTYHSQTSTPGAEYWVPNDESQSESMDIYHHCLTLVIDGKLFLAPLETDKLQKVIDIGTGTGIWAIDFADAYPHIEVIGTDISPIQPSWIPPNLRFEIEDATQPWTYPAEQFDFVHMRALFGSVQDWTALYREAYAALRPGCWLEDFENSTDIRSDDGTVPESSAMAQFGKVFKEGGKKFGRSFTVVEDGVQERCMAEAGFVDIQTREFKVPIGSWPADPKLRQIGQYARLTLEQDIEGYVNYMWSVVMGWTKEEITVYIAHLRRELRSRSIHAWYKCKLVYGRKPERYEAGEQG